MAPHAEAGTESPRLSNGFHGVFQNSQAPPQGDHASRPNILYIMADQMAASVLQAYDPDSVVQTPNIDKLAETGVVFDSAYCNSPLCAPSRFCMMSGQLPSKIKGYDNASDMASYVPTFAHFLRAEGYETALAGKMHFIGADQLHGFEHRLTTDIYPGDFGWSVNWDKPDERQEWYHNMSSVLQAGPRVRSNQLDYDEEVLYKSTQWLYDHVRQGGKKRPFCLTVSFTHPHDPYAITQEYWDRYEGVDIPMPKVDIPQDEQDEHSKRIMKGIDLWGKELSPEAILRARRAYFGACSYVDDQVGKLLKVLKNCRLDKDTIIIFSGDHGDMLGERGLWYKMSFYEMSARVPMIINYPTLFSPKRVKESLSTMDLPPTMLEMVGGRLDPLIPLDGQSFYPTLVGKPGFDQVFGEYMGETTHTALYMIRRGDWKYVACLAEPPSNPLADSKTAELWEQLYNLHDDPQELHDLTASQDNHNGIVLLKFRQEARQKWDFVKIHFDVLQSQRQRRLCFKALKQGHYTSWDYEPPREGASKYIRSTIPLDDLELRARYPPVDMYGREASTDNVHGQAGAAGE